MIGSWLITCSIHTYHQHYILCYLQPVGIICPVTVCPHGTVMRVQSIPGECCDNVTCEVTPGCVVNGIEYAFGDTVPSDNPCKVGW